MSWSRLGVRSDGWWGTNSLGNKTVSYENNTILTLDYSSSATKQFKPELKGTTAVGFQYYHLQTKKLGATANPVVSNQ